MSGPWNWRGFNSRVDNGPVSAKDWRAYLALVASIVGAAILTVGVAGIVWILWRGGWAFDTQRARIDAIARIGLLSLAIVGVVIIGLGTVINRRATKLTLPGGSFEQTGGGDEPDPPHAAGE